MEITEVQEPEEEKKEEKVETIKKSKVKSQAEKIEILLKKQKGMIKEHRKTAEFKEPIIILMRRTRKAEFYENAVQGRFEYTHSDGTERHIELDPYNQQTFDYGNRTFRGYICHEDHPYPLPNEPMYSAQRKQLSDEKILNDYRKWQAEEWKAKGTYLWQAGLAIAVIIAAYTLYKLLKKDPPTVEEVTAVKTAVDLAATQGVTVIG